MEGEKMLMGEKTSISSSVYSASYQKTKKIQFGKQEE
jgi:hypothetical protein